jgi:outer membrane protein
MRSFVVKTQILGWFSLALAAMAQTAPPAASTPAPATAHVPTKIGIIQIQSALLSTKDGQKAMQEFNAKLEPRKRELDKKAADIRELQDKLQRGGAAMAEAAKADLTRNIDAKTKSYNRDMEDATAEADQEQRKLLGDLTGKMTPIIDKYAQANGYAVILDVTNPNTDVLYASTTVDITKDIIEMYDKAYPVTVPATAAPKPAATPAKPPAAPATTPPPTKKQPQ